MSFDNFANRWTRTKRLRRSLELKLKQLSSVNTKPPQISRRLSGTKQLFNAKISFVVSKQPPHISNYVSTCTHVDNFMD
ncbi:CLUMA_CG004404, isoform A [Clunio marinus]|uniref:CLUMA_CG004404, isoform A n=1 Tax=Clunio marinus TaxID=568069 RepID=A0A1J1HRM9_9DIPT|nr:CLUMA_CG004404, isoform A [Clunio marinus]